MPALRQNIIANYAGQAWMAVMNVAFVPLYIRVLGMEAFGLVGFMLSVQALTLLLDLGLGGMLNRELARRGSDVRNCTSVGDLVRTLEWIIWPTALLLGLGLWLASHWLAAHWLHPYRLTQEQTAHAVTIMGLGVALQLPCSIYSNGLSGLERQTLLNVINAVFATLRYAGVLPVLYWVSPTIEAFVRWQALVGLIQVLALMLALWGLLPAGARAGARFSRAELQSTAQFAGGLMAIMVLAVTVSQLDRMVLSVMRPLSELGYFSLAMSVAAGLGRMVQPMFNAMYPRYSRLVSSGEWEALNRLYHLGNQCLCVVIAAVSAVLVLFSRDVVYLWTGDVAVAAEVAVPLSILVVGTACNGLMNLPYALQLAHGWTRLAALSNLVALALGIPFCIWAVAHHGIVGASWLWLAINLGSLTFGIPLMHTRLLPGEMARWYLQDVLPSFAASLAVAAAGRFLFPDISRNAQGLLSLAVVSSVTLLAAAMAAPLVRVLVYRQWQKFRHAGRMSEG